MLSCSAVVREAWMVDSLVRTRNGLRMIRRLDRWFEDSRRDAITALGRAASTPGFNDKDERTHPKLKARYVCMDDAPPAAVAADDAWRC